MIIDASAIMAILLGEPEAEHFARVMASSPNRIMTSLGALHASVTIEARKGEAGGRECDLLLLKTKVRIVPVDEELYLHARRIWKIFGRGRHEAGLTVNECCSIALSSHLAEPLLYKSPGLDRVACSEHQIYSPLLCSGEFLAEAVQRT
jgi:ribonuclease VapC